jgi:predicted DsbA family dithiol-disulfide isomerase
MEIDIYSDIVCPWCRIGERRLRRALEDFQGADEVVSVFRPFQLDPSAPAAPESVATRLERKYGERARDVLAQASAAAAEEGFVMNWDQAKSVNTLKAHQLLEWALVETGPVTQQALGRALFTAHFEEGKDLADSDTLVSLARSVGLDAEGARSALSSDEHRRATSDEVERALRMGIRSVPTFVFEGRWAVQGAQPPEVLVSVMQQVRDASQGPAGRGDADSR